MTAKSWRIEPDALREADAAAAHYESERAGLGDDFTAAIDATYLRLEQTPHVGSVERYGTLPLRRAMVEGFSHFTALFELGRCLVLVGRGQDAIGVLEQAKRCCGARLEERSIAGWLTSRS